MEGPILALLGTLIVALLGFYQWRRTSTGENRKRFAKDSYDVHAALAREVEEIHSSIRVDEPSEEQLEDLRTRLNSFIIQNSVHLQETIIADTRAYYDQLELAYRSLLQIGGDQMDSFAVTAQKIPAAPQEYLDLISMREALLAAIRQVMRSDSK